MEQIANDELERLRQASPSERPRLFALYCDKVIEAMDAGRISGDEAAGLILSGELEGVSGNPEMSYAIEMACELEDEGWLDENQQEEAWRRIREFVSDYLAGKRRPTFFELIAYYDETEGGRVLGSASVRVRRTDGAISVRAGDPQVAEKIEASLADVQAGGSDSQALEAARECLPLEVASYRLRSAKVHELLTDPPEPFSKNVKQPCT